jgi:hypothetical protein
VLKKYMKNYKLRKKSQNWLIPLHVLFHQTILKQLRKKYYHIW